MDEISKYDVMCVERGDLEYLEHVAAMLLNGDEQLRAEAENIAKALIGIVNSSHELNT